jgi:hypothetical protein
VEEEVDRVGDVEAVVAVRVARLEAGRLLAALEQVIEEQEGVGDLAGWVPVGVAVAADEEDIVRGGEPPGENAGGEHQEPEGRRDHPAHCS